MASFSDMIFDTYSYKQAPGVANAKIICNGEECGAMMFRGEDDPSPGELPVQNRWMHVFNQYNRTAMIGNPEDFNLGGRTNEFFWADLINYYTFNSGYVVDTGSYSPGEWDNKTTICVAPLRVGNAGIVEYHKRTGNVHNYTYCVFINGKMVYSSLEVCPFLFAFPFGFAVLTVQQLYDGGVPKNYWFADRLISFTKYGDSKPDWVYNVAGATLKTPTSLYGWNISQVCSDWRNTNAPSQDTKVYESGDYARTVCRSYTCRYVLPCLNGDIGNRKFYWCPSTQVTISERSEEYLQDVRYWTWNPLQEQLVTYSNEISTSAFYGGAFNLVAICPLNTSTNRFSNWGVYLTTDDNNNYVLRSYQNMTYHWSVNIGVSAGSGSIFTAMMDAYVDKSFDIFRSKSESVSFYFLFYKGRETDYSGSNRAIITDLDIYFRKCTLDQFYHMYNMSSSNYTFSTISVADEYTFSHPLVSGTYYFEPIEGFQRNHSVEYRWTTGGSTYIYSETYPNPRPQGSQWAPLFMGSVYQGANYDYRAPLDSYLVYDYKGDQLEPCGGKYRLLNDFYFDKIGAIQGDRYDLEPIVVDIENIQGSLNR